MSQDADEPATTATPTGCGGDGDCGDGPCETKRRRLLGALAAGGLAGLAGCLSAIEGAPQPSIRGDADIHWVNFLRQDQQVEMRGSQTVLRTAEQAGIELPYFCRAGYCGVCLSRADGDANEVLEMSTNDYEPLTDEAVSDGYFLPCTSQPRANFAVQSHVDSEALDPYQPEDDDDDEPEDVGFHEIEYAIQEATLNVPRDRDILRVGEDAGLELPYACREGFCGQCLSQADADATEVVEHTTNDYDPLDDEAMAEGYFLTCTGQPRDDFSFESGKAGDL